jgi:hypothetical protein
MGISAKHSVPGPDGRYKYWAFISYSHRDEAWARWLHAALETYRIPKKLVGRPAGFGSETVPERVYPVFRDRDEMAGSFDLNEGIKLALEQSRYLVVICSPHAAASMHVRSEVETFEAFDREDRVICLIVDGEPNASDKPHSASQECLPGPVRTRKNPDGTLSPADPLAADVRKGKDGKVNAKLKILATILGVGFDDLKQREMRRRFKSRLLLVGAVAGLSLLAGFIYALVLDGGIGAPGGQSVRRFLDRHQLSLLRPVQTKAAIHRAARLLRTELSTRLQQARTDSNWFLASFKKPGETDVWIHSQVAWALLSSPEVSAETVRSLVPVLGYPYGPGVAVESGGVKYGWFARPGESGTLVVPAFWTSLNLAVATRKAAFPTSEAREQALQQLSYAQEVLALYHPPGSRGWNLFPNQNDPSQHNTYATTLGLMALLEMRRAQLPWRASVEQRDLLLQSSFQWLVAQFDADANPPGWQAGSESLSSTCDGLTLQIFGRLLDAEAEAGLKIPVSISKEIPRHLARCDGRSLNFPCSGGEFSAFITNHVGQTYVAKESVNFLWHPWAIDCAVRWLKRAETHNAPPEERVAVQRTLGHLVINLGDEAARVATNGWTFIAAESLYGLSAVPPPDGSKQ